MSILFKSHIVWTVVIPRVGSSFSMADFVSLGESMFPLASLVAKRLFANIALCQEHPLPFVCGLGAKALVRQVCKSDLPKAIVVQGLIKTYCAGKLDITKYLTNRFNLDSTHRDVINIGLSYSCSCGRLEMLQWVVEYYGITLDYIRSSNLSCLTNCCSNGQLDMASWLVEHFEFTEYDVHAGNNSVLRFTCRAGHIAIVKWLVSKFGFKKDDVLDSFRFCCRHGHLELAQWLYKQFKFTGDDICLEGYIALQSACQGNHINVVKWLCEMHKPNEQQLKDIISFFDELSFSNTCVSFLKIM